MLEANISLHGIPKSILTEHGSGFKSAVLKKCCNNLGIEHVFCPIGDHRGSGLVERTIQTIKRKLGTEAFSPLYKNLNHSLHTILEELKKSKHATLKMSPFDQKLGRKPNTVLSLAKAKTPKNFSNQGILVRSLLKCEDRQSQEFSRDKVKEVKSGKIGVVS